MGDDFLPYGRQNIDEDDINAVVRVLRGPMLTQGPEVDRFEQALCAATGAKHAVAVCNGTAALHIAMLALGAGPEDEIIVTPNTFVASANCARYCGAGVRFADINLETMSLDPVSLERVLQGMKKSGKKPKAIVNVLFSGNTANAAAIHKLASAYSVPVLEDACHALGGKYPETGRPAGCGDYSLMSALSFHPVKHITTAEGGAVVTNDDALAEKLRRFRTHGITKTGLKHADQQGNPWYYEMQDLGFNYRITDVQCALGSSQLKKLPAFIERRGELAAFYDSAFSGCKFIKPMRWFKGHACHLYVVRIDFKAIGKTRAQVMTLLRERGVGTQVHYIPVYRQPYYTVLYGTDFSPWPQCESFYGQCLSIPMYQSMTVADAQRVAVALKEISGEEK